MSNIDSILANFKNTALHPGRMAAKWKEETGRKVVGCLPIHNVEELVHAAGMLPVGLWGGQTTITRANEYLPAFACSIMKAVMEFSMTGVYRDLDAVISPSTCDTMRCIPLMMRLAVPELPVLGLVLPDNRKNESAINYLAAEYKKLAVALEEISGQPVTDHGLQQSIEIYNDHRRAMNSFLEAAADHCEVITPYYRHMVIKSSFFVPREVHTEWLLELTAELKKLPQSTWQGQRVVVTGIMAEPYALLKMFEKFNLAIVGDDLAQGSRQFRTEAPGGTDPYLRLANKFAQFEGCSCVHDPYKLRGRIIADLVEKQQADGVVVLMMKFCDPEEYDYPFVKQDLDKAGIPSVYVEIEQQMESMEQIRTRLQAFSEILAARR
ncbi:MAG: 2-hydroxyacyl-CoA dehydratase [Firmicutes bacterium]|nr:2-hydroxyacyl-CoA dehydratase [Bacillota bacterium]